MAKGRHASAGVGGFYKDLAMMVLGIVLVGAAVFLLLYVLAGDGSTETATASTEALATTTSSTVAETTTTTEVSTTTTEEAPTTSATVPVRPPNEVRVIVLNSISIAGVAGRLTQELAEAGYQTLEADNYDPEQDPSQIWYREDFSAEATELLAFVPDALVEPIPDEDLHSGADVVVVIGAGYEE